MRIIPISFIGLALHADDIARGETASPGVERRDHVFRTGFLLMDPPCRLGQRLLLLAFSPLKNSPAL